MSKLTILYDFRVSDDFRLTACLGLLKCVVKKCGSETISQTKSSAASASASHGEINYPHTVEKSPPMFVRTHTVLNIDASRLEPELELSKEPEKINQAEEQLNTERKQVNIMRDR